MEWFTDYCDRIIIFLEQTLKSGSCVNFQRQEPEQEVPAQQRQAPAQQIDAATAAAASEILNVPVTQPLSQEEDRALSHRLKRKVSQTGSTVGLPIFTGGRHAHVSFIPTPVRGSAEASERSKRRRCQVLDHVAKAVAGWSNADAEVKQSYSVVRLSQQEREVLLTKVGINIPAADVLSLGLHLRLSNEQQRKLRLWTQQWNIHLASEKNKIVGQRHHGGGPR